MTVEHGVVRKPRRTPAEIEQVVSEFEGSGLNRSQFCRHHGLTLGTLNRYLKRMRGESPSTANNGGLVAVELAGMKLGAARESVCGLAVVLSHGRRIEIGAGFDGPTLRRLVQVLETV
jgi:hypothetical protein